MQCREDSSPHPLSPLPGIPDGKAAKACCIQLNEDNRCVVFGQPWSG
jgi:hypothetical protein